MGTELLVNVLMLAVASLGLVRWGEKLSKHFGRKGTIYVFSCWILIALHTVTLSAIVTLKGASETIVRIFDISTWCLMAMLITLVAGNAVEWGAKKFGKNGPEGPNGPGGAVS